MEVAEKLSSFSSFSDFLKQKMRFKYLARDTGGP
jgi:hypothetical protein